MDESAAETIRWLVDRAQISELLYGFAGALDTKDAASYVDNYAEGGILELPDPTSSVGGVVTVSRDDMMEFVQKGLMEAYSGTHHISTNHQITVTGDTAVSRSYLHAVHVRESPFDHWDAGGWYDCSYARTPEGWKFTRVRLTVVWLAGDPGEGVTKVRR
jgi:ketosteroid isomerase-like protein